MKKLVIVVVITLAVLLCIVYFLHTKAAINNKGMMERFEETAGDIYTLQSGASQFETLTKLETDVTALAVSNQKLSTDLNTWKDESGKKLTDIDARATQFQTDASGKLSQLQQSQNKDLQSIDGIHKSITEFTGKLKSTNDNITIINGRLVDITGKQQSQLDNIHNNLNKLTTVQNGLSDQINASNRTIINTVNNTVASLTNDVNTKLATQTNEITKVDSSLNAFGKNYSVFETDQKKYNTSQTTTVNDLTSKTNDLNESIQLTQGRITDVVSLITKEYAKIDQLDLFVKKNDLGPYVTKNQLDGYATKLDIADYISRNELSTYIPRREVQPLLDSVTSANSALQNLATTVSTIGSNYVTKTDLPKLAMDATGATALSAAIDGAKSSVASLSDSLAKIKASLANYYSKTETDEKLKSYALSSQLGVYAKRDELAPFVAKATLDKAVSDLQAQIQSIKAGTESIMDTMEVKQTLKVNQIKAHPQTYNKQLPPGWSGGVHTVDVYANANIATGQNGEVNAYMNQGGDVVGKYMKSTGNKDGWNWMHVYRNDNDQLMFGGDNTNRGIWSWGGRPFTIYQQGNVALTIDNATKTTTKNLNVDGHLNVQNRLFFKDPIFNDKPGTTNNDDPYYMEKVIDGNDASHLRLTMNNNPNESLQIWGDACREGNCNGIGAMRHRFDAEGNAWHRSHVDAQNIQGRDRVSAGGDKTFMRNDGLIEGDNVNARSHIRAGNGAAFMRNDGTIYAGNMVDGQTVRARGALCVGGTCINESQLQRLINTQSSSGIVNGQRIRLESSTGRQLENGGGLTAGATVGAYGWDGSTNKMWRIFQV